MNYLYAATARLFRYFCAVMTPTNRKLLDWGTTGFSVLGISTPPYSFFIIIIPPPPPQPPVPPLARRLWPAFFSSVARGRMSLDASVNPTTRPSNTLNHDLRLLPAISAYTQTSGSVRAFISLCLRFFLNATRCCSPVQNTGFGSKHDRRWSPFTAAVYVAALQSPYITGHCHLITSYPLHASHDRIHEGISVVSSLNWW